VAWKGLGKGFRGLIGAGARDAGKSKLECTSVGAFIPFSDISMLHAKAASARFVTRTSVLAPAGGRMRCPVPSCSTESSSCAGSREVDQVVPDLQK